jgi:hypothetical protein
VGAQDEHCGTVLACAACAPDAVDVLRLVAGRAHLRVWVRLLRWWWWWRRQVGGTLWLVWWWGCASCAIGGVSKRVGAFMVVCAAVWGTQLSAAMRH